MKINCPICSRNTLDNVFKVEVPVLQNRVYNNRLEAESCGRGIVNLTVCNTCNFVFNSEFDVSILNYDTNYDNAVPSKIFHDYYRIICKYLNENYDLQNGIVYDIGCGKGDFLRILCDMYPGISAIGIDPSYEGELNPQNNLSFVRDFFKAEYVTQKPSLVLSRHVFEHIEYPLDFLASISNSFLEFNNVPVFIEVPDFNWIVENETFWDICYEHCNYFTQEAISYMFNQSKGTLERITNSFGSQYLWVEGTVNSFRNDIVNKKFNLIGKDKVLNFVNGIKKSQENIIRFIDSYKKEGFKIVVWGMATKGVIFTNIVDRKGSRIDICIDININKQNRYSPITAHIIRSPEVLKEFENENMLIIVMNTNYLDEIKSTLRVYNINASFVDAHGDYL